jgi:predicted nucleic acid-binding protein
MIVVSDTSPLTALMTVGKSDLLARIFGEVLIPTAVKAELLRSHVVLPDWLKVHAVSDTASVQAYTQKVDLGEAEAIVLAEELQAEYLLMDERKGRRLAQAQHLQVIGLLGVLLIAKRRGLIPSARELLSQLDQQAGIYLSTDLKNTALKTVGE